MNDASADRPVRKGGQRPRPRLMVANWKMNYGRADEALDFVRRIRHPLNEISGVERVLCPPFTVLTAVADALAGTEIALGAQTMHWDEKGAHTGEVSPAMLADLCRFVILGHSERRGSGSEEESDAAISRKARAALAHALTPIICVGENRAQREAGETISFVGGQVAAALDGLTPDQSKRCAIAYEPIWAIGTGQAATPEEANRVIGLAIRGMISQKLGESAAQSVQVLYGGSVTVENMASFAAMPEIDGALVGGASLRPDFVELVRQAI